MNKLANSKKRSGSDESGATAIEYGLLAALIAVVIIAIVDHARRRARTRPSPRREPISRPRTRRRRRPPTESRPQTAELRAEGRPPCASCLVILAALAVAGGTGFYVMQGLRPPAVAEARFRSKRPSSRRSTSRRPTWRSGRSCSPSISAACRCPRAAITGDDRRRRRARRALLAGSVARQVAAARACRSPGRPSCSRASGAFSPRCCPRASARSRSPISEVAGLGGLVLPGDRVDIILTYSIAGDVDRRRARHPRQRDGDEQHPGAGARPAARRRAADHRRRRQDVETPPIARTATLEVTPREAEMITLAQIARRPVAGAELGARRRRARRAPSADGAALAAIEAPPAAAVAPPAPR